MNDNNQALLNYRLESLQQSPFLRNLDCCYSLKYPSIRDDRVFKVKRTLHHGPPWTVRQKVIKSSDSGLTRIFEDIIERLFAKCRTHVIDSTIGITVRMSCRLIYCYILIYYFLCGGLQSHRVYFADTTSFCKRVNLTMGSSELHWRNDRLYWNRPIGDEKPNLITNRPNIHIRIVCLWWR